MHIFPRWVNLDDRVLFPRPRNTWLHNGMSGLLHTSRKLCTQACGCRRTLQYRDDDLLPHVSYESPHVLQHVLTSHFAWQGIWVRLAHGTCQKGPSLLFGCLAAIPVLPGRGPGPWQVTATDVRGNVQIMTLNPESHVLSALEAIITFSLADRTTSCIPPCATTLPASGPTATTSRYMGAGDYSDNAGWGRGGDLHWHIALGSRWGLWLDWVCWFSADISAPGAAQRKSSTLLRTGVGEINQRGCKFHSATKCQQHQRLGGRPESGNRGLASCFRNSPECE